MRKMSFVSVLMVIMFFGTGVHAFAQKVVNNLKVNEIVVKKGDILMSWQADSLTADQMSSLLSAPGETTVVKDEEDLSYDQKVVFLNTKPEISYPEDRNRVMANGLHFELDASYSPFGAWETEASGSGVTDGTLKVKNTFALNTALVYQLSDNLYVGGGTGVRTAQLFWKPVNGESRVSDAYGLPLYARFGVCEAFSGKTAGFINADMGVNVGIEKMRTSFLFDMRIGVYYGTTKIALGTAAYKPSEKAFFGDTLSHGYEVAWSLILGFRI